MEGGPYNYQYADFVLMTFANCVQYQYAGTVPLTHQIMVNAQTFFELAKLLKYNDQSFFFLYLPCLVFMHHLSFVYMSLDTSGFVSGNTTGGGNFLAQAEASTLRALYGNEAINATSQGNTTTTTNSSTASAVSTTIPVGHPEEEESARNEVVETVLDEILQLAISGEPLKQEEIAAAAPQGDKCVCTLTH